MGPATRRRETGRLGPHALRFRPAISFEPAGRAGTADLTRRTGPPVVLVETADQAAHVDPGDGHLLAVSPWAELALEQRGLSFSRPEDHVDRASRQRLGLDNFERTLRVTTSLDESLVDGTPLAGSGFRPGFAHYFWLKVAVDGLTQRLFDLVAIAHDLSASRLRYWPTMDARTSPGLDFMGESMWALLAPLAAERTGAMAVPYAPAPWHPTAIPPSGGGWRRLARGAASVLRSQPFLRRSRSGRREVLALDTSLISTLIDQSGFRVLYLSPDAGWQMDLSRPIPTRRTLMGDHEALSRVAERAGHSWDKARSDQALKDALMWDGIDLLPPLESRLRQVATRGFVDVAATFLRCRRRLQAGGVAAVVSHSFSEAPSRAIAMAARSAGVPVFAYDHGAMGYYDFPMDRYLDSACADYRLVWGDGVKSSVERHYPDGARPIPTGSVELDALLAVSPSARRRRRRRARGSLGVPEVASLALYVVTSMSTNHAYESHRIASDSDYFARQRVIIRAFRDHPGIKFVVKLHPAGHQPPTPIVEWAKMCGIDVTFISDPPLGELIDAADLFINDSPTTTLLQMLTRQQRILACSNGGMVLEDDAKEPLGKAISYADSAEDLTAELHRTLDQRDLSARNDSGEFLCLYGTHLGDGRSGERIVESIVKLGASVS